MKKLLPLLGLLLSLTAVAQGTPSSSNTPQLLAGKTYFDPVFSGSSNGLSLNLQWLGACGILDGTTIFNAAEATAETTHSNLYLPGICNSAGVGPLNHSSTLQMNGTQLIGDGIGSVLNATDTSTTPHSGLQIQGNGVVVRGINFQTTWTGTRSVQVYSCALCIPYGVGATLTNFSIDHNYFTSGFAGPFIQLDYAGTYGDIGFNYMTGAVKANPIIVQGPVSQIDIHDNFIQNGADNCIELVDYSHAAISVTTYVRVFNNELNNCGGAGIAVLGSAYIDVIGNQILASNGRGITVASESSFTESPTNNVNVIGNSISGAGTVSADYYILVYGTVGYTVSNVNILSNALYVSTGAIGIQIGACDACASSATNQINVSKNVITGDGVHATIGIVGRSGVSDLTLEGNQITGMQQQGILTQFTNTGTLKILGNHLENLSLGTAATYEAIKLNNPGFSSALVNNNSYTAGANAVSHFITCTSSYSVAISSNIGSATDISGCTNTSTSGTVTSVALADASTTPIYTISGSPITAAGTLNETLATQTANTVFGGPSSGSAAQPTFRALVTADLPSGTTPVGANPTGSAGLSAVNGSAATFLRSDAAPALSLGIAPNTSSPWTASPWVWSNTEPRLGLYQSGAGTDLKLWDFDLAGGVFSLRTRTDADGAGKSVFSASRGATTGISDITLANTSDNPTVEINTSNTITAGTGLLSTGRVYVTSATRPTAGMSAGAANSVTLDAGGNPTLNCQSNGLCSTAGFASTGTKFTTSGCSVSSTTGGGTAGTFTLGANSCTVVITMNGATGLAAANGWSCTAHDKTTIADLISGESSSTTTTASIVIPVTAGSTDVISFSCAGY